jgi:segregation and condensation protein A
VELEPRFAGLLPEVLIGVSPQRLAAIAAQALVPKPVPVVATDHLYAPQMSVREQMGILRDRLRRAGTATFRALVSDCSATIEVVGRFLAVLELYRDGWVAFDQVAALSELSVRWTGPDDDVDLPADSDEEYA